MTTTQQIMNRLQPFTTSPTHSYVFETQPPTTQSFTFGIQPPIQPPKPKTDELKVLEEILSVLKDIRDKPVSVPPSPSVIHKGIFCNMCQEQDIRGIRYKCHTCLDYDICASCESKNIHPHNFIKINKL